MRSATTDSAALNAAEDPRNDEARAKDDER
jgi:hypothetical protein